ncbi:MAG: ATP-binding protein [Clostridia bacterium]|jgi:predicted AAA+ superfamily ATPase|nr:ATP-binding protein [Clostridia bacterium]MEE0791057.1 ATP-binding protein [Clostridia bacterium]
MIERKEYLEKLKKWKDKDLIKVITGIRRCGKSTLFEIYIDYLKSIGIEDNHIISVNLENPDNEFDTYKELYKYVKEQIKDKKQYYVFLDEVQKVSDFQKAVDGLYIMKNVDVYITGSNAYLLSGELATLLTGRYIEIKMYPLSFKEYLNYYKKDADEKMYLNYINRSSFPYALKLEEESEIDDYLDALYNTIIVKDIGLRKKMADTTMLRTVARFMFNNIGNCLSIKKIADTLTSDGRSISVHTVESYLESLVESYVFNKVSRFDIKGKQYLQSGEKYYATDVTMRYALLGRRNIDVGHILENIVYLELIRRGYKVYIGKAGEKEIDFVAENKEGFTYFQVAYTTREKATLERELTPLQDINDHYPKYILTMDIDPIADYDGIKKVNVLDWLLEK